MMLSDDSDEFEIVIEEEEEEEDVEFSDGIQETDDAAIVVKAAVMERNIKDLLLTANMDCDNFTTCSVEGKTRRSVCFSDTVQTCQFGRGDPVIGVTERWTMWTLRMVANNSACRFHLNDDRCCFDMAAVDCLGTFNGSILVRNLAFKKDVMVRLTVDEWKSYVDIPARFQSSVGPAGYDIFEFDYDLNTFGIMGDVKLGFAVCCTMNDEEFWDNNEEANYEIITSANFKVPSPLSLAPLKEPEEEEISDVDENEKEASIQTSCSGVYANYFLPTSILLRDWNSI